MVAILYVIGMMLKTAAFVKDKYIPLLLGAAGVVIAFVWVVGTTEITVPSDWFTAAYTGFIQGILCAGSAVYANQLYKQVKKDK